MDDDDRERLLETLDEWIRQGDFSLVQDGDDLAYRRRGARGYHYTSKSGLKQIAQHGLGRHPGLFMDHEFSYWVAMPFITADVAIRAIHEHEQRRTLKAIKLVTDALAEVPDLKVLWFYREEGFGGRTAGARDDCVSFDLHEVGEWLSENTESPHEFTDHADGYAVAWIGPPIPPRFLTGCDDTVFPPVQKNRRSSRPRRNPELLKKGTRLTGSFSDDGSGWRYSDEYPSIRGQRWVASLGLSRGELSVEGATEYDPSFRSSLAEMAEQYPELLALDVKFDGPRIPIAALVQSDVPTIEETSWLHGTSSGALQSIVTYGLRPRGETGAAPAFVGSAGESRPEYVYLTTQRNMARMAARAAARSSGGVPVVLRVEPLPVSRMHPDEDSGKDVAEESLWRIGSIAYRGSISPDKIAVDEALKDGEWSPPVSSNRRTSRPKRTSRRRR